MKLFLKQFCSLEYFRNNELNCTRGTNYMEGFKSGRNCYDILALTKTWLGADDNFSVAEMCPTGYYFHHKSQTSSCGGSIGLLMKKHAIGQQPLHKFKSFEYIDNLLWLIF